jgi:hypothetical protein
MYGYSRIKGLPMKTFTCYCGNTLHFENTQCRVCGRTLGFLTEFMALSALEPEDEVTFRAVTPPAAAGGRYRRCLNYSNEQVCNWMVPADGPDPYCRSCRLNHIIPNLNEPANRLYWHRIEMAKRRLLYTLLVLNLPVIGKDEDADHGLAFQFLADPSQTTEFTDTVEEHRHVLTGFRTGIITINVAEADASAREEMREKMNEAYRTLLGHFRHESGHYYWVQLVEHDPPLCDAARVLFGDERADYDVVLKHYYVDGPRADWANSYISAYASAHPLEDWAETWAHYLHMVDTLETARDMGFTVEGRQVTHPREVLQETQHAPEPSQSCDGFSVLLSDWMQLTVTMNALNRSMGLPDAYPFTLSETVTKKLRFVHDVIGKNLRA